MWTNYKVAKKAFWTVVVIITVLFIARLITERVMYHEAMKERKETERKEELLREVEPVLNYAKAIMNGEIHMEYDRKNPLSVYRFNQNAYPDVVSIDVNIDVLDIDCEENDGIMEVFYATHYKNKEGKAIAWGSSLSNWTIHRDDSNDDWRVVKVKDEWGNP